VGVVRGQGLKVAGYSFGCHHHIACVAFARTPRPYLLPLLNLFSEETPDLVVVEDVFSLRRSIPNRGSPGQVSGVVILAASRAGIRCVRFPCASQNSAHRQRKCIQGAAGECRPPASPSPEPFAPPMPPTLGVGDHRPVPMRRRFPWWHPLGARQRRRGGAILRVPPTGTGTQDQDHGDRDYIQGKIIKRKAIGCSCWPTRSASSLVRPLFRELVADRRRRREIATLQISITSKPSASPNPF